jgi:hypothetical protein
MRLGSDLDLCLEKFPANVPRDAEIGALKQRVRRDPLEFYEPNADVCSTLGHH